jgi:hypothetical protein
MLHGERIGKSDSARGVGSRAHKDVSTTMIYTHVLNKGGRGVKSPLDRLQQ